MAEGTLLGEVYTYAEQGGSPERFLAARIEVHIGPATGTGVELLAVVPLPS
jgi:hypothetical protein